MRVSGLALRPLPLPTLNRRPRCQPPIIFIIVDHILDSSLTKHILCSSTPCGPVGTPNLCRSGTTPIYCPAGLSISFHGLTGTYDQPFSLCRTSSDTFSSTLNQPTAYLNRSRQSRAFSSLTYSLCPCYYRTLGHTDYYPSKPWTQVVVIGRID